MAWKRYTISLDPELQEAAAKEFERMGISFSKGISMLLKSIIVDKKKSAAIGEYRYELVSFPTDEPEEKQADN